FALISAGWAVVAYLSYIIFSTEIDLPTQWDPWQVLGVSTSAAKSEIKRAYYALSRTQHPDKVDDADKERANVLFAEISKAYKVLTNAEARQNFEDWGHPDGKQAFSMGIALPSAIVDAHNSPFVLLGYGLVFGVFLPYRIGQWWYRTRKYTKDGILSKSMGVLFKRIKDDTGLKSLLVTVAHAQEFVEEIPYRGAADDAVVAALEAPLAAAFAAQGEDWDAQRDLHAAAATPAARRALAFLLAHLVRPKGYVPSADAQRTVTKAAMLLQRGALQITLARGWLVQSLYTMDLTQLLAQGTWHSRSALLQVPHVTIDHVKQLAARDPPVRSLQEFSDQTEAQRRTLFKDMKPDQVADMNAFTNAFPRIVLEKLDFKVIGETGITPGALVTCTMRVRLVPINVSAESLKAEYEAKKKEKEAAKAAKAKAAAQGTDGAVAKRRGGASAAGADADDEDSDGDFDSLALEGEGDGGAGKAIHARLAPAVRISHAPRFPADKRPGWWVFIGNLGANRVITPLRVSDLEDRKTLKLQFQAPGQPGTYPFSVFIKSDHWVGADMRLDVQMKVDPPRQDAVVEDDDDISDPEEDTIAGQMALLRGQRVKTLGEDGEEEAEADESDSSSDED
ncbi:hypothetical protein BC828DRAFT_405175, partial [Blastocladiella britannica]